MSNYYLYVVSKQGCPFSKAAENLLNEQNIKQVKIKSVDESNKNKYKNDQINTFPQIYLRNNNNKLLIGGYNELTSTIDKLKDCNNIEDFIKEKSHFSKIQAKKLCNIINQK